MAKFLKHLNTQICNHRYISATESKQKSSYQSTNWRPVEMPTPI